MRAWNTETRDKDGRYYRTGDWSVSAARAEGKSNCTTISPPAEAFNGCACDWIDGKWVIAPEALASAKRDARAERYKAEADPLLLAALGYQLEYAANPIADTKAKMDTATADYLAAKAKIRAEVK